MARKINYNGYLRLEGVNLKDAMTDICYLGDNSTDSVILAQQYIIVPGNVTDEPVSIILREDAVFTYFFAEDLSIAGPLSLKINGGTTEFNLSPDLWSEEDIVSISVTNTNAGSYSIAVVQLFGEEVTFGG